MLHQIDRTPSGFKFSRTDVRGDTFVDAVVNTQDYIHPLILNTLDVGVDIYEHQLQKYVKPESTLVALVKVFLVIGGIVGLVTIFC